MHSCNRGFASPTSIHEPTTGRSRLWTTGSARTRATPHSYPMASLGACARMSPPRPRFAECLSTLCGVGSLPPSVHRKGRREPPERGHSGAQATDGESEGSGVSAWRDTVCSRPQRIVCRSPEHRHASPGAVRSTTHTRKPDWLWPDTGKSGIGQNQAEIFGKGSSPAMCARIVQVAMGNSKSVQEFTFLRNGDPPRTPTVPFYIQPNKILDVASFNSSRTVAARSAIYGWAAPHWHRGSTSTSSCSTSCFGATLSAVSLCVSARASSSAISAVAISARVIQHTPRPAVATSAVPLKRAKRPSRAPWASCATPAGPSGARWHLPLQHSMPVWPCRLAGSTAEMTKRRS